MRLLSELPLEGDAVHRIGGADLCKLLDLSPPALTDLKKREIAVHLAHDVYDLEETVRRYVVHLRGIAAGWGTADEAAKLTAERARLAKEQADAQAMKNATLRGELVKAADVERAWADILRNLRARILAVPARVRPVLNLDHAGTDALDRELRTALEELGRGD